MKRTVALMLVGVIVGAAAAVLHLNERDDGNRSAANAVRGLVPVRGGQDIAISISAPESFEANLGASETVADLGSPSEIEARIAQLGGASATENEAELKALLLRLADLDPARAVTLARKLMADSDLLTTLFKVWADTDPDTALADLGQMPPSLTQRTVALGLLDVFGVDAAGIERVAGAFAPDPAANFRVDALGRLAERDLVAALNAADDLPGALRTIAQQRIAQVMARIDPLAAFEQARKITVTIYRRRYINALVDNWAKLDPDGVLDFLETAELPELELGPMSFRALAASSPERLLAAAEQFQPATRAYAQQAAVWALTALDPVTAYDRVSKLPPSGEIDQLIGGIAERYARQSPDAALAWATSLERRSPTVLNRVLATVAETDPARAADAVIARILDPVAANSTDMPSLVSLLSAPLRSGAPEMALIADTLAGNRDPRVRLQLDQLLTAWPQGDPEGALAWVLRNPSALTQQSTLAFADRLGNSDPALAQQNLQRMPAELRSAWLTGAAGGMAANDLNGTLAWLESFSGDPGYDDALIEASSRGVRAHPEIVARLIDDRPQLGAPLAPQVASAWASSDLAAAESWVLDLAQGPVRDRSIQSLLQTASVDGSFDAHLLESMSSDSARQQAVLSALPGLGRSNPARGRQLIAEYIDDSKMHAEAESLLESRGNLPLDLRIRLGQ